MTDKQALALLSARDAKGLEWIIGRYTPYVSAVISSVSRDALPREDVEELTADVFVRLWQAKNPPTPEKLKAYLGSMARNAALTRLRRRKDILPLDDETIFIAETDQAELLHGREREEAVRRAVRTMPMPEREIFVRRYYYGQSAPEIAALVGLSPEAVRQRLHRGRETLRQALLKERVFDETEAEAWS